MFKEIVQCSHCNGAIAPDVERCDWCGYYFVKPKAPKVPAIGYSKPDTWNIQTTACMIPAFEPIMSMYDIAAGEPVRPTPNGVAKWEPEMKVSIAYPSEREKKPGEYYSTVIPAETVAISRSTPQIKYRTAGGMFVGYHELPEELSGTIVVRSDVGDRFYHGDLMFDVNVDGSRFVGCKATHIQRWMDAETKTMSTKIEFVALNYVSGYDSRRKSPDEESYPTLEP